MMDDASMAGLQDYDIQHDCPKKVKEKKLTIFRSKKVLLEEEMSKFDWFWRSKEGSDQIGRE